MHPKTNPRCKPVLTKKSIQMQVGTCEFLSLQTRTILSAGRNYSSSTSALACFDACFSCCSASTFFFFVCSFYRLFFFSLLRCCSLYAWLFILLCPHVHCSLWLSLPLFLPFSLTLCLSCSVFPAIFCAPASALVFFIAFYSSLASSSVLCK